MKIVTNPKNVLSTTYKLFDYKQNDMMMYTHSIPTICPIQQQCNQGGKNALGYAVSQRKEGRHNWGISVVIFEIWLSR